MSVSIKKTMNIICEINDYFVSLHYDRATKNTTQYEDYTDQEQR